MREGGRGREGGRAGAPGGRCAPDVIHEGQAEELHPLGRQLHVEGVAHLQLGQEGHQPRIRVLTGAEAVCPGGKEEGREGRRDTSRLPERMLARRLCTWEEGEGGRGQLDMSAAMGETIPPMWTSQPGLLDLYE